MIRRLMTALCLFAFLAMAAYPLKVLYPNGGETLFLNKQVETIKWQAGKDTGDVVILLYKNGIKQFEIQKIVVRDPSKQIQTYTWKLDPRIKDGTGYRIRIRSLKNLAVNDFSDFDFTIKRK